MTSPGLRARLEAMPIAELETFLDRVRASVKAVKENPPVGRQQEVDKLMSVGALAESVSVRRHLAMSPPDLTTDTILTQAISDIDGIDRNSGG